MTVQDSIPRLDILLYAHDGRGLGHASRTIAIGMAMRRIAPKRRVLFLSGSEFCRELIGPAPLDWIKLPSYETVVVQGKSRGVPGKSNFSDAALGLLRSRDIAHILSTYRPRLVLADHSPRGKHRELLPALQKSADDDVLWVLGIRGITGEVGQVQDKDTTALFTSFYKALLWYGDADVLGSAQTEALARHYHTAPVECGYVSRMREYAACHQQQKKALYAATVSVPWFGESTPSFLENLYKVLCHTGDRHGHWMLYLDNRHKSASRFRQLFADLPWVQVKEPGQGYMDSLLRCRCAIIYGGYNSLVDVISTGIPALVVIRDMTDGEQEHHVKLLLSAAGGSLLSIGEKCSLPELVTAVDALFN
ncbi:MAG TPA: hypothetical protein VJ969_06205, partial [Desulfopila sp.]|nr:hypothetical protein [Desulfopila sp.]